MTENILVCIIRNIFFKISVPNPSEILGETSMTRVIKSLKDMKPPIWVGHLVLGGNS